MSNVMIGSGLIGRKSSIIAADRFRLRIVFLRRTSGAPVIELYGLLDTHLVSVGRAFIAGKAARLLNRYRFSNRLQFRYESQSKIIFAEVDKGHVRAPLRLSREFSRRQTDLVEVDE
jgi:hypothetical protein